MNPISLADVQQLVLQLPAEKLPHAFRLLKSLSTELPASQSSFLKSPKNERARLLTQQAADLLEHYTQTANERQEWQSGDFHDGD
jgi:hypothetical protein